jgi:hypothetical protein
MNQIEQVQLLLEKVELISWKYRQVLQGPEYRFNVFSLLRSEDDEVHLHSRFLAELLDPDGDHCQDDKLLSAFLQRVGIEGFRTEDISVRREYRDIDVLVTNEDQAIVIENKIYAHDQERQLERYYDAMCREGFEDVFTVYLTLDGSSPSRYSLGGLPDRIGDDGVTLISYRDDVREWLDDCIATTCRHPVLRETLIQYQRLVERLAGRSYSRGHIMEIKELLIDEKNIELAVTIQEALVEAQIDIQLDFWEELEQQLRRAGFDIAQGQPYSDKYSRKKIRRYYETKTAGWHYGITIKLADYDEDTALVYCVKVSNRVYYGFRAYRGGTNKIADEPRFDKLAAVVKQVDSSLERSKFSIGYKSAPALSFDRFQTSTVFALADPEKRERIVSELVDEVSAHITTFMELYESYDATS